MNQRFRRVARRIAQRYLESDLSPPLGFPGGPCHVVQRIHQKVRSPAIQQDLAGDVERGDDLSNSEASKVYRKEIEKGKGPFRKIHISPHAQYRMDLRSVTATEVRLAISNFFRHLNNLKSRGQGGALLERYQRAQPIEWIDPKLNNLKVVFRREGRDGVQVITAFWQGQPDPGPPGRGQCQLLP